MNFIKRFFTGMKQEAEPVTSEIAEEVEKSTLVSQPEPVNDNSPYNRLKSKYRLTIPLHKRHNWSCIKSSEDM